MAVDKYEIKGVIEDRVPDGKQRIMNTFFFLLGMEYDTEPGFTNLVMRLNDTMNYKETEDKKMEYLIDYLFDDRHTSQMYRKARELFDLAIDKVYQNEY